MRVRKQLQQASLALVAVALLLPSVTRAADPVVVVPQAHCRPGDLPETGLQGEVPRADRIDGRAAMGYNCNLKLIGSYQQNPYDPTQQNTNAWATLDVYKNCAYYGQDSQPGLTPTEFATADSGVVVVDLSDPAHPRQTAFLTTPAMQDPWESLRVNARRGLLVGDSTGQPFLDVYDVSHDCAHPKLLFSGNMPTAVGHEGFFQPDGTVYYMSCDCSSGVWPIDLTNPSQPKEMGQFTDVGTVHGLSISDDGTRAYMCEQAPTDAVEIVDTTDIDNHRAHPQHHVISTAPLPDNAICQSTYPVSYGRRKYVIQYGEQPNQHCPDSTITNFSTPHVVDISNERNPVVVTDILLQVDQPSNCSSVVADYDPRDVAFVPGIGAGGALFMYDVHHCSPDRLHDPTILACAYFLGGMRVFDIRNPYSPKELAYYNMGDIKGPAGIGFYPEIDDAISRPVILADRGLIVWTTEWSGIHVATFEGGVFPFPGYDTCPTGDDYLFKQYNPGAMCGPGSSVEALTRSGYGVNESSAGSSTSAAEVATITSGTTHAQQQTPLGAPPGTASSRGAEPPTPAAAVPAAARAAYHTSPWLPLGVLLLWILLLLNVGFAAVRRRS